MRKNGVISYIHYLHQNQLNDWSSNSKDLNEKNQASKKVDFLAPFHLLKHPA